MKAKYLLLSMIFMISCASTKGIYDKERMEIKLPYLFQYNGPKKNLRLVLKKLLILNGYEIADDDFEVGVLSTKLKLLDETEKFNSDWTALLGVNIEYQKGRIIFDYKEVSKNQSIFKMICKIKTRAKGQVNLFETIEKEDEKIVPQGHPLSMKFKTIFMKYPKYFKEITDRYSQNRM